MESDVQYRFINGQVRKFVDGVDVTPPAKARTPEEEQKLKAARKRIEEVRRRFK